MFITAQTIRRYICENDPPLIDIEIPEGVSDKERSILEKKRIDLRLRYIEGSCFDLELRAVQVRENPNAFAVLGTGNNRVIPAVIDVPFDSESDQFWRLEKGVSYKLKSLETINLPSWLIAIVHDRSSIFRSDADQNCTFIKPGYRGEITTRIHSVDGPVRIQRGFRFCSVAFATFKTDEQMRHYEAVIAPIVEKQVDPYDGIWGGSKTTTNGLPERSY